MLKTIGTMLVASLVSTVSLAQSAPSQSGSSYPSTPDRPPVFVTDSQSWEVSAHSGGGGGAFAGEAHGGARPQTAEIIKTFGERCPQVITNNIQAKTNYVVVLDHEGGKNYFQHRNKVAVFNRVTGDSIVSKSTLSLGGSVQTACEAFRADWTQNAASIRAAEASETGAKEKPPTLQLQQVAESGVTKIFVSSTPAGTDIEVVLSGTLLLPLMWLRANTWSR